MKITFFLISLLLATGCYRLKSEDDLRTVPVTNNPLYLPIEENSSAPIPGSSF
ncbi:MAG: hypothetical protein ACOVOR_05555 [Rhabdochlamydiaceae bacterium]